MRIVINKILFNNIKQDLKSNLKKKTIAKYYGLSDESIRKINKTSSWKKWEQNKKELNLSKQMKLKSVESKSNWFTSMIKQLKG